MGFQIQSPDPSPPSQQIHQHCKDTPMGKAGRTVLCSSHHCLGGKQLADHVQSFGAWSNNLFGMLNAQMSAIAFMVGVKHWSKDLPVLLGVRKQRAGVPTFVQVTL